MDLADPKQYVAPGVPYDSGAIAFCRLIGLGLREHHTLLDFGCGSLRVGRFLITLLEKGNYYAIEPQAWLQDAGIAEMGYNVVDAKKPQFLHNDNFNAGAFGKKFDFILISSIITHQSHAQMAEMFKTAALAPGGTIVGDFRDVEKSGADYLGEEWVYPTVTPHYQRCITDALPAGGWEYEELDRDPYGALWFKITKEESE